MIRGFIITLKCRITIFLLSLQDDALVLKKDPKDYEKNQTGRKTLKVHRKILKSRTTFFYYFTLCLRGKNLQIELCFSEFFRCQSMERKAVPESLFLRDFFLISEGLLLQKFLKQKLRKTF